MASLKKYSPIGPFWEALAAASFNAFCSSLCFCLKATSSCKKSERFFFNGISETFMGVDQKTGPGTNPRIPLVVFKSDSDHGTATTAHRTLGLTPAGTICHSNLSLSYYALHHNNENEESSDIRTCLTLWHPCPTF